MVSMKEYNVSTSTGDFYIDTISELSLLPNLTKTAGTVQGVSLTNVGSTAFCYEDKNVYILCGDNSWKII